jgi:23S rRNA pseudouridine1911/1915/1917 synthase
LQLTVDISDHERLDAWIASRLSTLSRSRIQDLIREQYIFCNGKSCKPRDSVKVGDVIVINLPEAVPDIAAPQEIPLNILYEDDDLIVIDKEPGMVVHPAAGNPDGTLVNALLHHCQGRLSGIGGVERPGIVHRLDKDTSGCLVVAKHDQAHQHLSAQFADRSNEKIYLCITQGIPSPQQETVFTHIGRDSRNRQKMAVLTPPAGRASITDYTILWADAATKTAFVRCDLHTGRTHQIRVHMKHKGTPLIGDPIYATPARQPVKPGRLMLHAWALGINHPRTEERLRFTATIPPEFTPWLIGLGGNPDPFAKKSPPSTTR